MNAIVTKAQYSEPVDPGVNEHHRVSEECHLVVEGPDLGGSIGPTGDEGQELC